MIGFALEWWLRGKNKLNGATIFTRNDQLIEWNVNDVLRPNQNQINSIVSEYQTHLVQEKISRRSRKKALLVKLNIDINDLNTLKELLEDGNED